MRLQTVELTGSPAASWQRCTRLSKVDLRTMCSGGISFCCTFSDGSCWRSWITQAQKYKVTRCYCWEFTKQPLVRHQPVRWALEGLQGVPGCCHGAEQPPLGISSQVLWWGLVEYSYQEPEYTTKYIIMSEEKNNEPSSLVLVYQ